MLCLTIHHYYRPTRERGAATSIADIYQRLVLVAEKELMVLSMEEEAVLTPGVDFS